MKEEEYTESDDSMCISIYIVYLVQSAQHPWISKYNVINDDNLIKKNVEKS